MTSHPFNVHMYAYGEVELAKRAIASIPDGVTVHVFDGRHAEFGTVDDPDLTPKLREFCGRMPDARYYAPDDNKLPFGSADRAAVRHSGWKKAVFAFRHLPPNQWTLKVDADETFTAIDPDFSFCDLIPSQKYAVPVDHPTFGTVMINRLFVPRHWTPYIGDCQLPRALFPRDTPFDTVQRMWNKNKRVLYWDRGQVSAIRLANHDDERSLSYQRKRVEQLRARGRPNRAAQLEEELAERFGATVTHP